MCAYISSGLLNTVYWSQDSWKTWSKKKLKFVFLLLSISLHTEVFVFVLLL